MPISTDYRIGEYLRVRRASGAIRTVLGGPGHNSLTTHTSSQSADLWDCRMRFAPRGSRMRSMMRSVPPSSASRLLCAGSGLCQCLDSFVRRRAGVWTAAVEARARGSAVWYWSLTRESRGTCHTPEPTAQSPRALAAHVFPSGPPRKTWPARVCAEAGRCSATSRALPLAHALPSRRNFTPPRWVTPPQLTPQQRERPIVGALRY